jgi:hypothetical protein
LQDNGHIPASPQTARHNDKTKHAAMQRGLPEWHIGLGKNTIK